MSNVVEPLRVLVCGPDLLARVGLTALLTASPAITVVGQAAPTEMPVERISVYQPDAILWDVGWTPQSQLIQLADVTEAGYPVVVLLPEAEAARVVKPSGVQGLLLRSSETLVLAAALQAVATGLTIFDPTVSALLFATIGTPDESYTNEPLTPREQEVLQAMAQGLSNKLIARQLDITEHTVKFHVNAILGKLGAQSRTEAVVRATRAGLILL
ncbi:MAG: DNA-binding response regulator [Caldilinea sp. CFX5]|nr:DNA-binding response regulator [Caldilinea sp. CFX5]